MTILTDSRVSFETAATEKDEVEASATSVRFLSIPERRYLAIEGDAPPGEEAFQQAIGALFGTACPLHFALSARGAKAPIGHLHGVFWIIHPEPISLPVHAGEATVPGPMQWRLLIAIPDEATVNEVDAAIQKMMAKCGDGPMPAMITWEEGRVAQTLHVGAYDAEYPTIERLTAGIREAGLRPVGCHHEIYLSEPKTPPERTRTVIRQPVEEVVA